MVPPEPAVVPVPVTERPPDVPVVLRMMPLVGPLAAVPELMLRKVKPLAPMVVLVTLRAVPVVVVSTLAVLVALTVPPVVAVNAAFEPVERLIVPVKLVVDPLPPLLLFSKRPAPPVAVTDPENVLVPPV